MPHYVYISRRHAILAALLFASTAFSTLAQSPAKPGPPSHNRHEPANLRTITSLREAHSLSETEASRAHPIHVRAVVTYYDRYLDARRITFFLHDRTGDIYADAPPGTTWPGAQPTPGTLVDVSGVSAPGEFAPILDQARITVLGHGHLPSNPQPVTLPTLLTGVEDSRWVEIRGVVHAVVESTTSITLKVAMDGGIIPATTVRRAGVDYQSLVDTWITIRGNAAPVFNAKRQLTGARLFFPELSTVKAVTPDQGDAFARPVLPVNRLLQFDPSRLWPHRVHLRGAVTLDWPGRVLCIHDASDGICAQTDQTTPFNLGSVVDLVGFTNTGDFKPTLVDAIFRPAFSRATLEPIRITPEQALQGDRDSELVQIDGRLIGHNLAPGGITALILSSGHFVYLVYVLDPDSDPAISALRTGSNLRVTGICSMLLDAQSKPQIFGTAQAARFSIRLQSPHSIVILSTPSWWTADRISLALLATIIITVAGFVWVVVLRRRVEEQTRALRQSREIYRHMAHHDELTGLPTRTLFHDHLQNALDRAQRFHQSIALLMLDLDKFKQINDSYGHGTGDRVLRITAGRLRAAIRKTDSLARMGGDEFIVLLNDLQNVNDAEQIAEKIVASLSEPVTLGQLQLSVSVSVGVCTLSEEVIDADLLLRRVDAAMYRAKERGRCCFQVYTADMLAASSQSPDTAALPSSETAILSGQIQ